MNEDPAIDPAPQVPPSPEPAPEPAPEPPSEPGPAPEASASGSSAAAAPEPAPSSEAGSVPEASASGSGSAPEAASAGAEAPDPRAAALAAEAAALKDRLLRLQADFDNFRKRQARDRADWIQQANADLLEELLPVLDQTDAAIASVSKDPSESAKPFLAGFELVRRTFLNAVAKFGLKPVEDVVGKPLDTATSEAITVMRTGQAAPGCVVYETRRGYALNGRILRAAQVVVEDEPEEPAPDGAAGREAGSAPDAAAPGGVPGSEEA